MPRNVLNVCACILSAGGVALNRALEHAAWSNALQSPLGSMVLASNPSSATGSWFTHVPDERNPNGPKIGALTLQRSCSLSS